MMQETLSRWLGMNVRILKTIFKGTGYEITFTGQATAYKLIIEYTEKGWKGSLSTTSGISLYRLKSATTRELYYKLADVTYAKAA